jgi:hypothetical protein
MVRKIIAYILFVLGAIIVLFFRHYRGNLIPFEYSIIYYLIGTGMWLGGYFLLRSKENGKNTKQAIELRKLVDEIKITGEKIVVNLEECEIKENSYTEEVDKYRNETMTTPSIIGDIQFWDGLYDSRYNSKMVDVNQSVLIFKYLHNGVEEKFISKIIPRTKEDLKFKLYFQKNTLLYVDRNNRKRFYFDLSFLNPEE